MLRGVVTGGTGGRAALGGRPVAGKTGSAQNNTSAFFSGFTPQLSTSVWVGYPARRVPMRNLFNGGPVFGGTFPALIFHNYMEAALAGQPVVGFPAAPPPPAPPPPAAGGDRLSQQAAEAILARTGATNARRSPRRPSRVAARAQAAGSRTSTTVYLAVPAAATARGRPRRGRAPGRRGQGGAEPVGAGLRPGLHHQRPARPGGRPEPGAGQPPAQGLLRHPGRRPAAA